MIQLTAEAARIHPAWPKFVEWAEPNGVDPLGHWDDVSMHWECFVTGWGGGVEWAKWAMEQNQNQSPEFEHG